MLYLLIQVLKDYSVQENWRNQPLIDKRKRLPCKMARLKG